MKKLISLVVVTFALAIQSLSAGGGRLADGWNFTTVTAASGTVFIGHGKVKGVWASSAATQGNYFVLRDTQINTATNPADFKFTSDTIKVPYITLSSGNYVSGGIITGGTQRIFWSGDCEDCYMTISSACYVEKSVAASGGADNVTIMWSY